MTKLIAVDPPDCGCTECIIGEYVPMNFASPKIIKKLLKKKLRNHTGYSRKALKRYHRWITGKSSAPWA